MSALLRSGTCPAMAGSGRIRSTCRWAAPPRKMPIAISAAVLACMTMLAHRAHVETLRLQTEAARKRVEESNKWNYYQTKNLFRFEAERMLDEMRAMPNALGADAPAVQKKYEV